MRPRIGRHAKRAAIQIELEQRFHALSDGLVIRRATLLGNYLHGKQVQLIVSPAGKILDCDAVHCVWSGHEKFDAWFRQNYNPAIVMEQHK